MDDRQIGAVAYDAFRQTAFFTIATIVSLQLLASVVVGATGDAPYELRVLAMGLNTFLLEPPMVNPECVEGVNFGDFVRVSILAGGICAAVLDKVLQLVPYLRAERLCFGWKCCSKQDKMLAVKRFCWTVVTPFLRYFLSTGLTVAYVRVVRVALGAVDCVPSDSLGGAYALDTNALVPCFEGEHLPVFILAVAAIVIVGIAWPLGNFFYLRHRFTLTAAKDSKCWNPMCVREWCDSPASHFEESLPEGWTVHFNEARDSKYYAHAESGATMWEHPSEEEAAIAVMNAMSKRLSMADVAGGVSGTSNGSDGDGELPLPLGWSEHLNDATKRTYYFNEVTGETVWERPTSVSSSALRDTQDASGEALPEGWEEHHSPEHGQSYYHHAGTSLTSWVRPRHEAIERRDQRKNANAAAMASIEALAESVEDNVGDDDGGKLPEGWSEHVDKEAGASYYHHAASQRTIWTRPTKLGERARTMSPMGLSEASGEGDDEQSAGQSAGEASEEVQPVASRGGTRITPKVIRSQMTAIQEVAIEAEVIPAESSTTIPPSALQSPGGTMHLHNPLRGGVIKEEHGDAETGWMEHQDPSGRSYFHHAASQRTLWERPVGTVADAVRGNDEWLEAVNASGAPAAGASSYPLSSDNKSGGGDEDKTPIERCVAHVNEMGCIPICVRDKLNVDRTPAVVQKRVDLLGSRARAYDTYVDNAFEPRFFWIPTLRLFTLFFLAVFDLGFSGRAPPTLHGALARSALSSLVVLIFTVCVLAPCPYHRIDRWNIAKRLALLVLQNLGLATTLSLTMVELSDDGMNSPWWKSTTTYLAGALMVMLPIAFLFVFIAFLLSRGTGCCNRCLRGCDGKEENDGEGEVIGADIEMTGGASDTRRRSSTLLEDLAGIGSANWFADGDTLVKKTLQRMWSGGSESTALSATDDLAASALFAGNTDFLRRQSEENKELAIALSNPMVDHLAVAKRRSAEEITIDFTNPGLTASSEQDVLTSLAAGKKKKKAPPKKYVTWKARRSVAPSLAAALYGLRGNSDADDRRARLDLHIKSMFGGATSLSVPQLLKLMRTRAKGTDLGTNMHTQLTLVQASTTDDHGSQATPESFGAALHAAIKTNPDGAVAVWLLDELEEGEDSASSSSLSSSSSSSSSSSDEEI